MGFEFSEEMSGTVEWDAAPGVTHPCKFVISVHADSLRAHLRDGKAVVRGTITMPPRAEAVDVEGVLTIRPIGQKIIRYELAFVGDDGKAYELVGQKDILYRHLPRTMTSLPAEILDEDHRRVAVCKTRFDPRHTWSFLRSFRPI